MNTNVVSHLRQRLFLTLLAVGIAAALAGGAYATMGLHRGNTPATTLPAVTAVVPAVTHEAPKTDEGRSVGENHGGPVVRVHEGCGDVASLRGNWTHGDYVSAMQTAQAKKAAARTTCGQPVPHEGGPHTAGRIQKPGHTNPHRTTG